MSRISTRNQQWRVRVNRAIEVWVEVDATTAEDAETKARCLPGVLNVFGRSAVRSEYVEKDIQKLRVQE